MAAPHEPRAPSVNILAALRSRLHVSARSPRTTKHSDEILARLQWISISSGTGPGDEALTEQ